MIRHFDGSNAEQITMQSKRGIIWTLEWTPKGHHRIFLTAGDAEKVRRKWVAWKKQRGLDVRGHRVYKDGRAVEGCFIVKYDAVTRKVLDVR